MTKKSNNSIVYLALLCLLYFLITSNYWPSSLSEDKLFDENLIYIEVSNNNLSTVRTFQNIQKLEDLKTEYSISQDIKSGEKITINQDKISVTKMAGRKRVSLGIPIGINSATSEDLNAIPGIGEELAYRIISSRENKGNFRNLDELDSIDGIGKKKLESIKKLTYVD